MAYAGFLAVVIGLCTCFVFWILRSWEKEQRKRSRNHMN
jgi:cbb3-type cytochrome oxidase subunit 3